MGLAPFYKVILCFIMEVQIRSRSSLVKTSAYSLRILCASCWSFGSHSAHPSILTFSRISYSRVGTSKSDQGGWGVSWVTSFSKGFGLLVWLTFDDSLHSLAGGSSPLRLNISQLGTFSAICTLPITVLGGMWTSLADKFLSTLPVHLEPRQRSPNMIVTWPPTWPDDWP